MKKYLSLICLLALWISGCSQEDVLKDQSTPAEGRIFTTSFDYDGSRTYLEEGRFTRWTEDDRISLFDASTLNRQYKFDGKTGDTSGSFSMVENPFGTGVALSTNYAVYPYVSDMKITENGVITTTLPSQQTYVENSFGPGANIMVAVTKDADDTLLRFKNANGCLKLKVYGDNMTVKSITLMGNNPEKLAGKANILAAYDEAPAIIPSYNATETITLDCGEGVNVGSTAETATSFWISVPPTVFEKGITVKLKDTSDRVFIQSCSSALEIKRNVIKPMATFQMIYKPYVTFSADAPQSLTMSKAVETLEYCVDDSGWETLGTNSVLFGGELGNLKIRGKSSVGTNGATITFGNHTPVSCSGDIRTLVDYENYEDANTSEAKFNTLFYGCTSLTSAPDLPATTLAPSCYNSMFQGCTSLTKAPYLPATTLANHCYYYMFQGCTSLTIVPDLPATTLAISSCFSMFSGCTSLTEAPDLQATTLASSCCYSMFQGCTSLTKAPDLPAITLATSCYSSMFKGCKSLTKAPDLPATTLANSCYSSMFYECTSLTEAPDLPALRMTESCYSYMFENCVKLTKAPNLPAPILAERCYYSMFYNCENLTVAPMLTATTLKEKCYSFMFGFCSKLQQITMLATNISANECLYLWTSGVASTGTFIKAKNMTSLPTGTHGIPAKWTVKDY